jgi:hypothetical protein
MTLYWDVISLQYALKKSSSYGRTPFEVTVLLQGGRSGWIVSSTASRHTLAPIIVLPNACRGFFHQSKRPRLEADPASPPTVEARKACSYTSTPYVCSVGCLKNCIDVTSSRGNSEQIRQQGDWQRNRSHYPTSSPSYRQVKR